FRNHAHGKKRADILADQLRLSVRCLAASAFCFCRQIGASRPPGLCRKKKKKKKNAGISPLSPDGERRSTPPARPPVWPAAAATLPPRAPAAHRAQKEKALAGSIPRRGRAVRDGRARSRRHPHARANMAPRTRKAAAAAAATGPPGKKPAASTSSLPSSLSSSLSSRPSVASLAPGKAAPAAGANGGVGCLASSVVDGKRKSQFEDRLSSPGRGNVAPAAAGRPRRRRPCCVFLAVAAILYACWLAAVRRVSGALEPLLEETGGRLQLELVAEKVVLPAAKDYLPQLVYDRFEAATRTVLARSRDWTAQSAFFLGLSKKEGGLLYSSPETIFQRGLHMKQEEGITAKHPLLLIPGIISTSSCSWLSHMKLDPLTGLDPEGVKLRASQGLEAADYLVPGYW
ncbi:MAG: hypothetical protein BJ554DRAFT_2989, partial [Olpidium bornovanus]